MAYYVHLNPFHDNTPDVVVDIDGTITKSNVSFCFFFSLNFCFDFDFVRGLGWAPCFDFGLEFESDFGFVRAVGPVSFCSAARRPFALCRCRRLFCCDCAESALALRQFLDCNSD